MPFNAFILLTYPNAQVLNRLFILAYLLLLLLPRVYSVRSAPLNDNVNFLQLLLFCLGIVVISKRIPGKNGNHVWWLRWWRWWCWCLLFGDVVMLMMVSVLYDTACTPWSVHVSYIMPPQRIFSNMSREPCRTSNDVDEGSQNGPTWISNQNKCIGTSQYKIESSIAACLVGAIKAF